MSSILFDVNVANGVAIGVTNVELPVWWMEVYPFCLTSQNHCHMPKLNYCTITLVDILRSLLSVRRPISFNVGVGRSLS